MTPDAVAVIGAGRSITFARLSRRVACVCGELRGAGVRAGDRIAYLGPNHPAYLELLFAAGAIGAVFVPVNFRSAAAEIDYILGDCGARVLFHTEVYRDVVGELSIDVPTVLVGDANDADDGAGEIPDEPVSLEDPCVILYTSGTTGRPKGAVLTHGNLTWNCLNVLVESDVATDEVALVSAPLFHAAALGMLCLPVLLKGGCVVLLEKFDPAVVFDSIEHHRVTRMFGVPAMYDALAALDRWETADLSSIRVLLCGGAPVPHNTIRRYLTRGLTFVQGYGMTEASPGALLLDPAHAETKVGSAGVPSFFSDVRVVDAQGEPVADGQRGEVIVSGPNVMSGYWNRPADTAEVLREGWFHSGDVATVDPDGYVYIVDRMKDVIISGGENIYPAEVENVLTAHPAVAACAVIGVPDERWGEVGRAVVVLADGQDIDPQALLTFARERLAGYKVPGSVHFVDELPRGGSGKILKSVVRDLYG
ncbi:acyl-CoA synthetase [Nocardia macrotermitis]|uniref:Long-chain-fatty-acid--CoA ligase FadD13 n=1 Tax=Nocardia macrotermitis TaxID=2585198 RepID=A0A7K0D895_9NOCA|nr:long-chain fatty acid--CoA ligase [Nocardia macrotermitis]MQY21809.1 Long-chain-fatty-acid--CoA ligase FadD13 [Nocardia macrotermitis]